jgi:uncharacterized repeat protein (TIGR04076 family)
MTGYPLEIRVVDIMGRGVCPLNLRVGDCFASDKELAQACHWAAHVLLPFTTTLRFGGQVPWEDEPGPRLLPGPQQPGGLRGKADRAQRIRGTPYLKRNERQ